VQRVDLVDRTVAENVDSRYDAQPWQKQKQTPIWSEQQIDVCLDARLCAACVGAALSVLNHQHCTTTTLARSSHFVKKFFRLFSPCQPPREKKRREHVNIGVIGSTRALRPSLPYH